ncbi:MAG: class I SAM-dependent methyltransferase [Rhodobacteraceae bacterium]|nr:class I SAM-dependent methyltransferase [Paracoccaceae bacterium]
MSVDAETIAVYDARAAEYADMTEPEERNTALAAFIAALPPGGAVLDLGCGPGHASAVMADAGLKVTATDASAEMVALAARHPGVTARRMTFDEITGKAAYDGIWANFSLLHAPRTDMPRYLSALHAALKPGGLLHIGLKTGKGARRDGIGRLYTYFTEAEIRTLLGNAGFTVTSQRTGSDLGLDGTIAPWITLAAHA